MGNYQNQWMRNVEQGSCKIHENLRKETYSKSLEYGVDKGVRKRGNEMIVFCKMKMFEGFIRNRT